jgi:putative membrane protein
MCEDDAGNQRFKIMERKLFYGIMTPGGVLTLLFGLAMLKLYAWEAYADTVWLSVKLLLVVVLIVYHVYCGMIVEDFRLDRNRKSHVFYRWFNELPVLLLIVIVILVIVKPA